jgi:hypothetical protein
MKPKALLAGSHPVLLTLVDALDPAGHLGGALRA